jgi:hypothetical protein
VRVAFRHVSDTGSNLQRGMLDVEVEDAHLALVGHDESEQRPQHGALAGPVWAKQTHRAGGNVALTSRSAC